MDLKILQLFTSLFDFGLFIVVSDLFFPGEELEMEYEDQGRGTWLCRIK